MSDEDQKEWNRILSKRIVGNGQSKPATPEAPEWSPVKLITLAEAKERWPDPADRALDDFTARRKAKREVNPAPSVTDILHEALNRRSADILSRALSTPLPHDPDIHTRLMPWRGKE